MNEPNQQKNEGELSKEPKKINGSQKFNIVLGKSLHLYYGFMCELDDKAIGNML